VVAGRSRVVAGRSRVVDRRSRGPAGGAIARGHRILISRILVIWLVERQGLRTETVAVCDAARWRVYGILLKICIGGWIVERFQYARCIGNPESPQRRRMCGEIVRCVGGIPIDRRTCVTGGCVHSQKLTDSANRTCREHAGLVG
jgi:hypothetical protein